MNNVREIIFDKSTRTAKEAAEALGCEIGQIAKSIIFKTLNNIPILVIASGINRISEDIVENEINSNLIKADADFVKDVTGFVIGGVPPWGHRNQIQTFIDEDLKQYNKIWASSGKTNAVFELTFEELVEKTGGKVIRIKY
jgi:prolyl-tRNA editing enzyme YbaK/EbsC (Cys-tRNA(Pro) deacylase)